MKVATDTPPVHPAPEGLSERSIADWRALVATGRARSLGRRMLLETALRARDVEDEARAERLRVGLTIESKRSGVRHVNPACQVEKDARTAFLAAWRQLGMGWDVYVDGVRPERST